VPRRIESHDIAGPAGRLEALLEEPEDGAPRLAVLVCHPHPLGGGTLHNKVVYRIARASRNAGMVVLRFNFRGVGRSEGEHAHLVGEIEDARAALAWLRARYPELPYALAGFSFGSRVITQLGCSAAGARWLLACGYPTKYGKSDHLDRCTVPKIFVQSTNDQYAPRGEFEEQYAGFAEPKKLVWVEAGDHFFAGALDQFENEIQKEFGPRINANERE
jgi:alpha/beta superfamily hydrolase